MAEQLLDEGEDKTKTGHVNVQIVRPTPVKTTVLVFGT
jgi:hypothetical protein